MVLWWISLAFLHGFAQNYTFLQIYSNFSPTTSASPSADAQAAEIVGSVDDGGNMLSSDNDLRGQQQSTPDGSRGTKFPRFQPRMYSTFSIG